MPKESAAIVYPETVSVDTVEQIVRKSILDGKTAILPIQIDVSIPATKARVKLLKEPELPWQITPSADFSKLGNHYLMLSKIRLTSKTDIPLDRHIGLNLISFVWF